MIGRIDDLYNRGVVLFAKINKKVLILAIILLSILGGGIFLWNKNQKDVRELNKNLPEGVRVTKSLFGSEYRVVNKVDGYDFKVPDAWSGVNQIEYIPEENFKSYRLATIELEGNQGGSRIVIINRFEKSNSDSLKEWAEKNFEVFGLIGKFENTKVRGIDVVKTQEEKNLLGMYVYFFQQGSSIYAITNGSEDYIQEIITSGKW